MITTTEIAVPQYYAVFDPADPARMLYYHRVVRGRHAGELRPWPQPTARYWPLWRRDLPVQPPGGQGWRRGSAWQVDANRAYALVHHNRVRGYQAEVKAAIEADPHGAAARFAALCSRCCCCGKVLTEEHSKVYGIGPECRRGMPPTMLERFVDAMGRAHGASVRSTLPPTRDIRGEATP